MFQKGWRQREQNAKDKLADQREMQADPAFQDRQAQYRELAHQQEAARQAERDRLRLERQGPVQTVADLFRERFRDDLPEIYEVLSKPQGVAKLLPILKAMAAEDVKVRRDAAEAARVEAERARMEADAERRVAAIAADRTKRKVREAARAEPGASATVTLKRPAGSY